MRPEFIEIVPQYPLPIPIYKKEDYYTWPVKMMAKKGFITRIITVKRNSQKEKETINGIEIIRFTNAYKLFAYVVKNKEAICYAQGKLFPLFTGFFAKKSVYITHSTMGRNLPKYFSNPFYKFIYKLSLSKFKKVITISPYELSLLKKFGFKNNFVYIPNAIDYDFFSKPHDRNEFLKEHHLSNKSKVVVFLGNMHHGNKTNIETLFKSFKIVLRKFPNSKLIVIGKFPNYIKSLREFVAISKSVILTGWLSHLRFSKIFAFTDVFVNTSRYEGNPLSVAEAACARIPLCLSDIPTLKSIYKNGAFYHNPDDYVKLSKNIILSLQNAKIVNKQVKIAAEKITSTQDFRIIRSKLFKLFSDCIEKKHNQLENEWSTHWNKSNINYSIKQIQYEDHYRNSFSKLFRKGDRVLEAGCGFGRYCFWLEKIGVKAVGIDIVSDAINEGKKYAKKHGLKSKLCVGDICKLPFIKNSFDGYISLGVVEHFENSKDVERVFKETYRVLKTGGYAYFSIPNPYAIHMWPEKILRMLNINSGITHYLLTKNDLISFSKKENFEVIDSGYHDFYFPLYSIIESITRHDIWVLKSIMKKTLNRFDRFPILNRFGSGIAVILQKKRVS
jgi:glycosyltransferase involved in cell wall biosynthesis